MNEDNRDEEQQYQGVVDTDRAETGIETSEPSVPSEAADAETVESPQSPQVDVEFVAPSDSTAETASESAPEPVEAPVMPTPSTPTEQKPTKKRGWLQKKLASRLSAWHDKQQPLRLGCP